MGYIPTQSEHHLPCVIFSYAGLSKVLQVGSVGDANGVLSSSYIILIINDKVTYRLNLHMQAD